MSLTDKGYSNILKIANDRYDLNIDKMFIDKHYDVFLKVWPPADDPEYMRDFPDANDAWWSFDGECNGGGIADTYQKDLLIDAIAHILFGMPWPLNCDDEYYVQLFKEKLNKRKGVK